MKGRVLLYGATGSAGRLLARRLRDSGHALILAGRDATRLATMAEGLGCPFRAFGLGTGKPIDDALADVDVVLHAAGPFVDTASPMMMACIRTRTHYLDLTGEWPVFVEAMSRSLAAAQEGVMLTPGVGFTLVASDCLLALATANAPGAVKLRLSISRPDVMSRGSVRSLAALVGPTVLVRRGGALHDVPAGRLSHDVDFGRGLTETTAVCWPDVVTGEFTTGVRDIETFAETNWVGRVAHRLGAATGAWTDGRTRRLVSNALSLAWPEAPPPELPGRAGFVLVAEAVDRWRRSKSLRMRTLDGYRVSVITACEMVRRVLDGEWRPGFWTPAALFGGGFVLSLGCAELETTVY
jgi:short subunit dehydrogenase-like uncharacterized protein